MVTVEIVVVAFKKTDKRGEIKRKEHDGAASGDCLLSYALT